MDDLLDELQAALDAYKAHQRAVPRYRHRIDRWWSWWLAEAPLRRKLMTACGLMFMYLYNDSEYVPGEGESHEET